MSSKQSK